MKGLLKEKSEIEKLISEYKKLSDQNFQTEKDRDTVTTTTLILEECQL